jgi:hypothetical protein
LSRRLAFKLPIVLRYNIGFAFLFGIVHSLLAKNTKWFIRYFCMIPVGFGFLCHEEIIKYLQIKDYIKPALPATVV